VRQARVAQQQHGVIKQIAQTTDGVVFLPKFLPR
jgi:hypothetical protein